MVLLDLYVPCLNWHKERTRLIRVIFNQFYLLLLLFIKELLITLHFILEFYGLDTEVLIRSLRTLEATKKAELILFDDNQGVKFF